MFHSTNLVNSLIVFLIKCNNVGLWVRLSKIKCAAKAFACVSACSSFNITKRWHFICHFSVRLLSVVSVFRVSANTEIYVLVGSAL